MNFETKYAPKSISDFPLDAGISSLLNGWLSRQSSPYKPILLHGPTGTGKTSLAKLFPYMMNSSFNDLDLMDVQSLTGKSFNKIIEILNGFCMIMGYTLDDHKFVLIDEIDYFSQNEQQAIKGLMDRYQTAVTFMLTTNNLDKVIAPIQSRCLNILMGKNNITAWVPRMKYILKQEGITGVSDTHLKKLAQSVGGDCRDILQHLETIVDTKRPLAPFTGQVVTFPKSQQAPSSSSASK